MGSPSKGVVLITGIQGFTGRYLHKLLREDGYTVAGLVFTASGLPHEHQADIRDAAAVRRVVDEVCPDYVIHLAAISHVAHGDAGEIFDINLKGTLNLLEALRGQQRGVRKFMLASSGNIYGAAAGKTLVTEDAIPQPQNNYGISKHAAEELVHLAADRLPTLITRPFNYTGIGQAANFIVPKLVDAFRRHLPELNLGDIDTIRDFSDVRWVARTYKALMESAVQGETVNVCSGAGVCIRDILHALQRLAGYEIRVKTDASLLRGNEIHYLVGSPAKLERLLTVSSRPALAETLAWMYAGEA